MMTKVDVKNNGGVLRIGGIKVPLIDGEERVWWIKRREA